MSNYISKKNPNTFLKPANKYRVTKYFIKNNLTLLEGIHYEY